MIWKQQLAEKLNSTLSELKFKPIGGGCINETYKLISPQKKHFVKTHSQPPENFFAREASGLKTLKNTHTIRIPEVICEGKDYLALEWIESARPTSNFFEGFGRDLANLHRHSQTHHGFYEDNYIGKLTQFNNECETFTEFFWTQRLEPQIRACSLLSPAHRSQFTSLENQLDELIHTPHEKPALIHGDLWSGNFICSNEQRAVLIDPAVAYSHREMELAFTELFGGFHSGFYSAYQEAFPFEPGYKERRDIYNLYPLMVHVNLFGGSYLSSVESILSHFI